MPHVAVNRSGRVKSCAVLATMCAALLLTGGSKPAAKTNQSARVSSNEPVAAGEAQSCDISHLGIWIDAARETFTRVRDYQCTFSKCERVDGVLQEEHSAVMKCRTDPFSVHLKFTAPKAVAGKEASYVQGRHNGKMRAKSTGALGLVGYITIDPRDPRAMQGTRHSITEAGIGNLIDRLTQARRTVSTEGRMAPTVLVAEYTIGPRTCVRFDVTDPSADGVTNSHRTFIYFDKETNLPARYESYDRAGDLIECFTYTELRFNLGLSDAAFP
jgi:hypothetical protein